MLLATRWSHHAGKRHQRSSRTAWGGRECVPADRPAVHPTPCPVCGARSLALPRPLGATRDFSRSRAAQGLPGPPSPLRHPRRPRAGWRRQPPGGVKRAGVGLRASRTLGPPSSRSPGNRRALATRTTPRHQAVEGALPGSGAMKGPGAGPSSRPRPAACPEPPPGCGSHHQARTPRDPAARVVNVVNGRTVGGRSRTGRGDGSGASSLADGSDDPAPGQAGRPTWEQEESRCPAWSSSSGRSTTPGTPAAATRRPRWSRSVQHWRAATTSPTSTRAPDRTVQGGRVSPPPPTAATPRERQDELPAVPAGRFRSCGEPTGHHGP